jgi:hypothetical protein
MNPSTSDLLGFAVPRLRQASAAARGAAHSPQNFAPSRLWLPQLGHFIPAKPHDSASSNALASFSHADADAVGRVHGKVFAAARPSATMVVVHGLLDPRWRVVVEAEAEI